MIEDEDGIRTLVVSAWTTVLGQEPETDDVNFFLSGDSLALVEFAQIIEDALRVKFPLEVMLEDGSLAGIIDSLVLAHREARDRA